MTNTNNILDSLTCKLVTRFWNKVKCLPSGCWEWQAGLSNGYGSMRVRVGKAYYTHRIAYAIYNQTDPADLCVRHRCDNRVCVNPFHLLIGTRADNNQDAVERNRYAKGEDRPSSKLTNEQVLDIRLQRSLGVSCTWLANKYCVARSTIYRTQHKQRWRHI
jgi:hypothetical protein